MADKVSVSPQRGQTLLSGAGRTLGTGTAYGTSVGREGEEKLFNDLDSSAGVGAKVPRSNKQVKMLLVRNTSGISLSAKLLCKWASGYRNKRVDGYTCVLSEEAAGVVDEFIGSSGVPNHDLFWLAVSGPHLLKTATGADSKNKIAEGSVLVAATAATSQATATAGRVAVYEVTTNSTYIASAAFHRLGRAMSAKTTAQTDADILVDLEIQSNV